MIQPIIEPQTHESEFWISLNSTLPNEISNKHEEELPIVKRKGLRSCTLHLMSKYACYSKLTPQYKGF